MNYKNLSIGLATASLVYVGFDLLIFLAVTFYDGGSFDQLQYGKMSLLELPMLFFGLIANVIILIPIANAIVIKHLKKSPPTITSGKRIMITLVNIFTSAFLLLSLIFLYKYIVNVLFL